MRFDTFHTLTGKPCYSICGINKFQYDGAKIKLLEAGCSCTFFNLIKIPISIRSLQADS